MLTRAGSRKIKAGSAMHASILNLLLLLAAVTFSALQVQPRETRGEPGVLVINSEADWKRFTDASPAGTDFGSQTVIAVFGGEKPTGGYSVRINSIEKDNGACVVAHRVVSPPRDAILPQVISHPFAVVRVNAKCSTATLR
jgi:hypothetical protein